MKSKILLGYEVGSGDAIYMKPGNTAVTGVTQESGKTTTLEALVDRGEMTAITFLTKRGESGFIDQRLIPPYYKEQLNEAGVIDWQYVESILIATMGEKMRKERSYIIDACKSARSLREVYSNLRTALSEATRGFDQAMLTNLSAYFDIILPEIDKYDFSEKLEISKGFNVMNLIEMPEQMQQLVIRASIQYVYQNLRDTVVILPEAHKFIPPSNTPVKDVALRLIKEGSGIRNHVWIDTQETTSVDKQLLKQCVNWIMGYQQEKNEVANVRDHLGKKVDLNEITSLKLGHYIASLRRKIYHLYVLPSGIDPELGKKVARGEEPPETVKQILVKRKPETRKSMVNLRSVLKQNNGTSEEKQRIETHLEKARKKIKRQEETIKELNKNVNTLRDKLADKQDEILLTKKELEQAVSKNAKLDPLITSLQDFIVATVNDIVDPEYYTPDTSIPVDLPNLDTMIDQIKRRIRTSESVKIIEINVDEAVQETVRTRIFQKYEKSVHELNEKQRELALIIREYAPMKATDAYYKTTDTNTGRPVGDFYPNLSTLEKAGLVTYDRGDKIVNWSLQNNLADELNYLEKEQIKALEETLVVKLLPEDL